MELPSHLNNINLKEQNLIIEKKVHEIIVDLGKKNIFEVGKTKSTRLSDEILAEQQKKIRHIVSISKDQFLVENQTNRYFNGPIEKWIREKLAVVYWLGLHQCSEKRVIDLGTGAGWFVYICKKFGHESYGTDILNRPEYEAGYRFLNINIIGKLSYPMEKICLEEQFDYITTMRSFIGQRPRSWTKDEWKFFFEDMQNYLKENGALYISCNCGTKLDTQYKNLPDNAKSFWGNKNLQEWFEPYVIPIEKKFRGMKPNALYISKKHINSLLAR